MIRYKMFSECSDRTKKQKILPVIKSHLSPELVLTLSTRFQKSRKISAYLLLQDFSKLLLSLNSLVSK